MRRIALLIIILFIAFPLLAAFTFVPEGEDDVVEGNDSMAVRWDLADLGIADNMEFIFTPGENTSRTEGSTASDSFAITPVVSNGAFFGSGSFSLEWKITSLSRQEVSLYLNDSMKSEDGDSLDWILQWDIPSGDGMPAESMVLGNTPAVEGLGYGESNMYTIHIHEPSKNGIQSSGELDFECMTDDLLLRDFVDYSGYVVVYVDGGYN